MKKPVKEDTFTLKDDFVQVISKSGNEYHVTLEGCNCMGYGFKGTCRHFKMAEEKGLLEQELAQHQNVVDLYHHQHRHDGIEEKELNLSGDD